MKKLYLTFLLLIFGLLAQAQNQNISVADFHYAEGDLTARTYGTSVEDQNGRTCALIKVETTEKGLWTFDVGMMGVTKTEMQNAAHSAEIWVWVPFGVTWISIQHDKLGKMNRYYFPCSIDEGNTYIMKLTTAKIEINIKEQVRKQYLAFQISPVHATLEVNDEIWEVDDDGNAQDYVDFGTYTYRVQAPNYHSSVGKVTVDDPDNTQFVKVTLEPNFGWIEVAGTGALQGASVYIDNALIGKAPCKSEPLKSGQHTVRIAKKMYNTYSETVTVSDNETTRLAPTLNADFAEVTLKVDADAEIWVNNEKKGTRTWTGPLGSGTYKMECKQANHETSLTTKEITAAMNGQTITLPAPTPIYGSLMVESTPKFCKIYIDGKDMGTTPKSINEILIGQHEIRLTQDGYADYTETVTISKGEGKQVKATLNKKVENTQPEVVNKAGSTQSNSPQPASSSISDGALPGVFSVSATQKVHFAQGNLQYQASTNTWRFASNQWDMIGDANKNMFSSYSGWIDLFGWGTGNNPTKNSKYSRDDYSSFTDWGSKMGGDWRTLTKDEWVYVFNTRSTSSGIRYAKATVNGVKGVILLPDNWNSSTCSLRKTDNSDAKFSSNKISASEWNNTFAPAGAVFLPAAGLRSGNEVDGVGSYGDYNSASPGDKSGDAYFVTFSDSFLRAAYYFSGYFGRSVRLACPAEN